MESNSEETLSESSFESVVLVVEEQGEESKSSEIIVNGESLFSSGWRSDGVRLLLHATVGKKATLVESCPLIVSYVNRPLYCFKCCSGMVLYASLKHTKQKQKREEKIENEKGKEESIFLKGGNARNTEKE